MTPHHELLLGISKEHLLLWNSKIQEWKTTYPDADIRVISEPDTFIYPNPKIAWNYHLASFAQADLWLWSDADILVPPHYLNSLLTEWQESPSGFLTNAYLIDSIRSSWGIWDHFFIQFEFLPGVFLLNRFSSKKTAYGAGILFHRQLLSSDQVWKRLGHHIADDYQLSQIQDKGRLSKIMVKTSAQDASFLEAFQHYQRWHKTIRWCDSRGYLGMIFLNPLLGWIILSFIHPAAILGMFLYGFLEFCISSGRLSPHFKLSHLIPALLWPWLRLYTWIWASLPTSVIWGGKKWRSPQL